MKKLLLLSCLLAMNLLWSCEDDDDIMLTFQGVQMLDINGTPIGCYDGPCDDDWVETSLTDDELKFLDFTDFFTVPADTGAYNPLTPIFYPSPLPNNGEASLLLGSDRPLKFKMAIVGSDGDRHAFYSTLLSTGPIITRFENSFFADVPRGEIIRIYYAYFDENDLILTSGYGDIGVCTMDAPIDDPANCFE